MTIPSHPELRFCMRRPAHLPLTLLSGEFPRQKEFQMLSSQKKKREKRKGKRITPITTYDL